MVEHGLGPGQGARSNGLAAARWVALGDLDPRVADALLGVLRDEGIAAYAAPTPAARGGYLELRLPSRISDRLYVDAVRSERAAELLAEETAAAAATHPSATGERSPASPTDLPAAPGTDDEAAWQRALAALSMPASETVRTWPACEDLPPDRTAEPLPAQPATVARSVDEDEDDEEHFVPPAPPPMPRLTEVTVAALLAIVAGVAVLVTGVDGGSFGWLAVLAVMAGAAALVWRVRDVPRGSDDDDGAVV